MYVIILQLARARVAFRLDQREGEPLRLALSIEKIKDMPSGSFVWPLIQAPLENKVVVCKEGEKIKIFRLQEENLR